MRLHVLAIGERLVEWQQTACDDYARRFVRPWSIEVTPVRAEPRVEAKPVAKMAAAEAQRLLAALPKSARRVVLDERGRGFSTQQLADRLRDWQSAGGDVAFLLGGPDGHDPALRESADLLLSLSPMTLPHGLARVLLSEQLYRATSRLQGHPYHRD